MRVYFDSKTRMFSIQSSNLRGGATGAAIGGIGGAIIGRGINRYRAEKKGLEAGSDEYKRMVRSGTAIGAGLGAGVGAIGGGMVNRRISKNLLDTKEKVYNQERKKFYDSTYQPEYEKNLKRYNAKNASIMEKEEKDAVTSADMFGRAVLGSSDRERERDLREWEDKRSAIQRGWKKYQDRTQKVDDEYYASWRM